MNSSMPCHTWQIEVTDTFSGEANYSWVRRYTVAMPQGASRLAIVRKAKQVIGWTGIRASVDDHGDIYAIRPAGACMVAFVNFQE